MRLEEQRGQRSPEATQERLNALYERWRELSRRRFVAEAGSGDSPKATFSFSENFLDDLLALRVPLYVMYGTRDIGSLGCDYLPLELERAGKRDYVLKAYPGLGHNYEQVDEAGRSNYEQMHWDEAFGGFLRWSLEQRR